MATTVPNNPFNVTAGSTAQQKAQDYNRLLGTGMTDAQIRQSAAGVFGEQSDENWGYLRNLAQGMSPAPAPAPAPQSRPEDQFARLGLKMPSNWGSITDPIERINILNNMGVTGAQLGSLGYSPTDVAWMQERGLGGAAPAPAPAAAPGPTPAPAPASTGGLVGEAMTSTPLPTMQAAQFEAQQRQVDRPNETAAAQVESLLAKDSPLMQRARTLALQNMNQRGLVNSSMAQGAGVAAMIDRITPIAQQDAQTYSNQALANQRYVNEVGMFNAGEQNKFGLLQSQQEFTGAQNNLDRAQQRFLQEQSMAAQKDLQQAQQRFQSAENGLDRALQATLQTNQQTFQSSQSGMDRSLQRELQTSQQQFTGAENLAGRTFEAAQRALDRTQQAELASAAQTFQATQNEKDRAQQIMLTDRNISAQQALETARQEFQRTENVAGRTFESGERALDRAQQQTLETARQSFQATQANLDRTHQEAMTRLANNLSQSNVSGTFAANITANTSSAINAIMADGNLTPDAKRGAIDNIIANANSTLQWGSTFYNTTLPGMSAPGGTSRPITPGGNAAPPPSPTPAPAAPTPTPAPSPTPRGGIVDGAMQRDAWGREPGDPMYGVDPNNISTDGGGASG
jgi:hypothetical protein